jgi:nucleoside-diphosphate-sugar epimerase
MGALPARLRRTRILVVGCGDVGQRLLRQQQHPGAGPRWLALTSQPGKRAALRAMGALALLGNLDDPVSLRRLAGIAHRVLHLAPPPTEGERDPRTRHLLRSLGRGTVPRALVYGSTSGVYGDCAGEWVAETRPLRPLTPRARRRVDAEGLVRSFAGATRTSVLRIPGIYAPDREGGTPLARLQRGSPVLRAQDDVFTNHIHADDLARACWLALWRGRARRVYNINDDSQLRMGDYFDAAARLYGLPPPPRVARADAAQVFGAMQLSFMSESRRLRNARMKTELRLRLRFADPLDGLGAAAGRLAPGPLS